MAVAKKRVSIPEAATEFWNWADQQNDVGSSLVFIVKAFINKYGNGDAICNYAFGDIRPAESKEIKKSEVSRPVVLQEHTEDREEPVAPVQPVVSVKPVPIIEQPVVNIPEQSVPVQPVQSRPKPAKAVPPVVPAEPDITAILDEDDSSSSASDSNDMLASMLNL